MEKHFCYPCYLQGTRDPVRARRLFVHNLGLKATETPQLLLCMAYLPHVVTWAEDKKQRAGFMFGILKVTAICGLGSKGNEGLWHRFTFSGPVSPL